MMCTAHPLPRAVLAERTQAGGVVKISGHGDAGMRTAAPAVRDAIVDFLQGRVTQ
jgi:FixJ family two-component response regulator